MPDVHLAIAGRRSLVLDPSSLDQAGAGEGRPIGLEYCRGSDLEGTWQFRVYSPHGQGDGLSSRRSAPGCRYRGGAGEPPEAGSCVSWQKRRCDDEPSIVPGECPRSTTWTDLSRAMGEEWRP